MSANLPIPYLQRLRERARDKRVASDSKVIEPSFRGARNEDDIEERLAFVEKCLDHEREQLRKTTELLRRAEARLESLERG